MSDVPEPLYEPTLADCEWHAREAERVMREATGSDRWKASPCDHDHSAELAAREANG